MNLTAIIAAVLVIALPGCGSIPGHEPTLCRLTAIAFDEQDELAPGWYESAVTELKTCGYDVSPDLANGRGFH